MKPFYVALRYIITQSSNVLFCFDFTAGKEKSWRRVIQAKLNKNGKQSKDKGLRAFQWYKLTSLEYLPASEWLLVDGKARNTTQTVQSRKYSRPRNNYNAEVYTSFFLSMRKWTFLSRPRCWVSHLTTVFLWPVYVYKMGHNNVWYSHPRKYGPGSRSWWVMVWEFLQ